MRTPRVTIGRMMLVVAVLAVACFAVTRLPRITERRGWALEHRRKESSLRLALERFNACRSGHGGVDRKETRCETCEEAWRRAPLNPSVGTPDEAIGVLREAADMLGRMAERQERGAVRFWKEPPPPPATEARLFYKLVADPGPIPLEFFHPRSF